MCDYKIRLLWQFEVEAFALVFGCTAWCLKISVRVLWPSLSHTPDVRLSVCLTVGLCCSVFLLRQCSYNAVFFSFWFLCILRLFAAAELNGNEVKMLNCLFWMCIRHVIEFYVNEGKWKALQHFIFGLFLGSLLKWVSNVNQKKNNGKQF